MDSTVQLGQTMYNQILSDMQLNISKAPDARRSVELSPAAATPKPSPRIDESTKTASGNSRIYWLIGGVLAAVLLAVFVIIALLLVLYRFS